MTGQWNFSGEDVSDDWALFRASHGVLQNGSEPIDFAGLNALVAAHPQLGGVSQADFRAAARLTQYQPRFLLWRAAELAGRNVLEHDDDYVLAMVGAGCWGDNTHMMSELLRHDDELRTDVLWRIFEVEGGGEISVATGEKTWIGVVAGLAHEGLIDRERALRSSLEALDRGFSAYRAGPFRRMHDALVPSVDDLVRDQALLLALLASPIGPTVSWVMKAVAKLDKAGVLDDEIFVVGAASAMWGSKATALAVIKLLTKIHGRRAELADGIAEALGAGLGHADAAVQEAAVRAAAALGVAVEDAGELLAPSVRDALGLATPAVVEAVVAVAAGPQPLVTLTSETITGAVAAVLAGTARCLDAELVMAYVAEHGFDEATLATVGKQATTLLGRDSASLCERTVAVLVYAWMHPEAEAEELFHLQSAPAEWMMREEGLLWPLGARTRESILLASARTTGVMLWATPTDTAGGIDGAVLAERMLANPAPTSADHAGAVLRVRPGHELTGAPGYAVGAAGVSSDAENEPAVWAVASRRRMPGRDDGALIDLGGWGRAQMLGVLHKTISWEMEGERTFEMDVVLATATPDGASEPPLWTSVVADTDDQYARTERFGDPAWHATIMPSDPEPLAARLVKDVARYVSWGEVDRFTESGLRGLQLIDGQLGAVSTAVLALALSAKQKNVQAAAVDLFVEAVPSRLSEDDLAGALAAVGAAVTLPRWAATFGEISTLSSAHALVLRRVLRRALPSFERKQRRLGDLLQFLLDEELRGPALGADPAFAEWLEGFTGSAAAAKVAQRLRPLAE